MSKGVPEPKILVSDRGADCDAVSHFIRSVRGRASGGKSFGSTKSGIAPFYSDKYAKIGFQVNELFMEEDALREKIDRVLSQKNVLLEHYIISRSLMQTSYMIL